MPRLLVDTSAPTIGFQDQLAPGANGLANLTAALTQAPLIKDQARQQYEATNIDNMFRALRAGGGVTPSRSTGGGGGSGSVSLGGAPELGTLSLNQLDSAVGRKMGLPGPAYQIVEAPGKLDEFMIRDLTQQMVSTGVPVDVAEALARQGRTVAPLDANNPQERAQIEANTQEWNRLRREEARGWGQMGQELTAMFAQPMAAGAPQVDPALTDLANLFAERAGLGVQFGGSAPQDPYLGPASLGYQPVPDPFGGATGAPAQPAAPAPAPAQPAAPAADPQAAQRVQSTFQAMASGLAQDAAQRVQAALQRLLAAGQTGEAETLLQRVQQSPEYDGTAAFRQYAGQPGGGFAPADPMDQMFGPRPALPTPEQRRRPAPPIDLFGGPEVLWPFGR